MAEARAPPKPQIKQPLNRPQTKEEIGFYARNHFCLMICAVILFLPFGLLALYFSHQTNEANKNSDWENAYLNSTRTIWFAVFGILVGLFIIYMCVLVIG